MGYTFVLDEKDCCSKVTSGLMGAIFHSVLGNKNDIIDGWQVNQEDLAKVFLTVSDFKKNKEVFRVFVELFPDSYWANNLRENPLYQAEKIEFIYTMLAETLAEMVVNKTDYIYAAWE